MAAVNAWSAITSHSRDGPALCEVIHEACHLKFADIHINLATRSAETRRGVYYIVGDKFLGLKKEKALSLLRVAYAV
jgi:hypothetical protein